MNPTDLLDTLHLIVVAGWASLLLLFGAFFFHRNSPLNAFLAALGLLAALIILLVRNEAISEPAFAFNGMVVLDDFAVFLNAVVLVSGLVGVALAYDYLRRMSLDRTEYYVLLMFSISGMMLMAMAIDLIIVFLALELLSFPLYVLSAFARPKPESEEAGLKYFLLGAFSSGFVVYGVALVFGATATTSLEGIVAALGTEGTNLGLLAIGAGLITIGLAFKVAVVPFHMWTPDVYQGAPTAIVSFMAVGAKVGGFAALLRIFVSAIPGLQDDMTTILWVLSALTMIFGNVLAVAQSNIKRLLAYSSIAQAGYILTALVPFGQEDVAGDGVAAALFYLVAYAFTNFAAWSVVIALEKAEGQGLNVADYAGLGRKYPGLAAAMTVAMLSFTGIPPTLGFVGKFFLFRTLLQGGFIWLAIIGVVTSVISAYYYLRVVVVMYMEEGEPLARTEPLLMLTTGVAAVGTVFLSLFSAPLFTWASEAVLSFF